MRRRGGERRIRRRRGGEGEEETDHNSEGMLQNPYRQKLAVRGLGSQWEGSCQDHHEHAWSCSRCTGSSSFRTGSEGVRVGRVRE